MSGVHASRLHGLFLQAMQRVPTPIAVVTLRSATERQLRGWTIGSFHSVSANPPLIGFNLYRFGSFHRALFPNNTGNAITTTHQEQQGQSHEKHKQQQQQQQSDQSANKPRFVVNILSASQQTTASFFAKPFHSSHSSCVSSPHGHSRQQSSTCQFSNIPHVIDPASQAPVILDSLVALSCEVLWHKTAAEHEVVVGTVLDVIGPGEMVGLGSSVENTRRPLVYYMKEYGSLE